MRICLYLTSTWGCVSISWGCEDVSLPQENMRICLSQSEDVSTLWGSWGCVYHLRMWGYDYVTRTWGCLYLMKMCLYLIRMCLYLMRMWRCVSISWGHEVCPQFQCIKHWLETGQEIDHISFVGVLRTLSSSCLLRSTSTTSSWRFCSVFTEDIQNHIHLIYVRLRSVLQFLTVRFREAFGKFI